MKKLLILISVLCLFLCAYSVRHSFAAPLTADDIDLILDDVNEAIDSNLVSDATNKLLVILKQEPKHPEANRIFTQVTGRQYVPPVFVSKKPVYNRTTMTTNLKGEITTTMGEARYDIVQLVSGSTKSIVADSLKNFLADEMFKKQMQGIMGEAIDVEKSSVLSILRESLELPAVGASTINENPVESSVNSDPKEKAKEYYQSALKLIDEQRYDDAKKNLQQAVNLDPENQEYKKALEKMGP